MLRKFKNYFVYNLQGHNYYQFSVLTPGSWDQIFQRCKWNRTALFKPEENNLLINLVTSMNFLFWLKFSTGKQDVPYLSPKKKPPQPKATWSLLSFSQYLWALEEAGSITHWSHVHNIYEIKRGLVHTKIRIHVFSGEH